MSQIIPDRVATIQELDAYSKVLDFSVYMMEFCKPHTKKRKDGRTIENNRHIPLRYNKVGEEIVKIVFDMGAYVLEANEIYVGSNLNAEARTVNLKRRISLESQVVGMTYRIEHMVYVLNKHKPFADNTLTYLVSQLVCVRKIVISWKESDIERLKRV